MSFSRLNEDFLRALRYVRFLSRFGKCEYDKESFEAVKRNAHNIHKISAERIREELEKGILRANSDAEQARWFSKSELSNLNTPDKTISVINKQELHPIFQL